MKQLNITKKGDEFILEINGDPMVTDASASFREEASRAYVGVFGKGMGK